MICGWLGGGEFHLCWLFYYSFWMKCVSEFSILLSRVREVSTITTSIFGVFWGFPWIQIHETKMFVRLGRSSRNIFIGKYFKKSIKEILVVIGTKTYNRERINTAKMHNRGNMFYFLWLSLEVNSSAITKKYEPCS